uniref:Uncharacterized protein n=1 Tax=Cannabis sativa TaxID=3483 RepID=A0A803QFJ2_CANSA
MELEDNAQTEADAEVEDNEDQIEVPKILRERGLEGYQLVQDRTKREIHSWARFAKVDLIAFALPVVQQTEIEELGTYEEQISCGNKSKWPQAMD